MLTLVPVSGSEIPELAAMADTIWHEYFPCILTEEQIDYMVDRFQSEHAMREQVADHGYQYFFITSDGERIGYTGIVPEGDRLFISKVYLLGEHRGKGLGTQAIKSIFGICEDKGYRSAYLTVTHTNDFYNVVDSYGSSLNSSSSNCSTSCDCEYVFNRHKEWLVCISLRFWDIRVKCVKKFLDACA